FGRTLRLLFEFHAFKAQKILRALDRIFQRAVCIVELRALFEAPFLFAGFGAGVEVRMELAAELIKLALQQGQLYVQLARKAEEREVVHRDRRLYLAAGAAEVLGAHGSTGPAGGRCIARHDQRRFAIWICHRQIHHDRSVVAPPESFTRCEQGGAVVREPGTAAGMSARSAHAEKELPQPQDFVEFGFTNTKPCCISVSW